MRKRNVNPTVANLRNGSLRFKRRLDVPMWHHDHLSKVINTLEEVTAELRRIKNSNTLRNFDKCVYAQHCLMFANQSFSQMTPKDPRTRGASIYGYPNTHYMVDENGHEEVQARKDLDEPTSRYGRE